ncbi:MAG: hypothetical protein JO260_10605, partial [Acidobacteria bacterium]|nr:hypothetical protein [Acidobacteriota bacterium]
MPAVGIVFICLVLNFVAANGAAARRAQHTSMGGGAGQSVEGDDRGIGARCCLPDSESGWKATDMSLKCVTDCLKGGSPIAILTKDGDLYLPISDKMPDYSQREKLMPFVGKYVLATGIAFERNGMRAIVISEIAEVKDVKV